MDNAALRRRKDVGAALGATSATIGLAALGAKGAKPVLRRVIKDPVKSAKVAAKIDAHVGNALVAGAGIGGAAGLNGAQIQRAEAKRIRVQNNKPATKEHFGKAQSQASQRVALVRRLGPLPNTRAVNKPLTIKQKVKAGVVDAKVKTTRAVAPGVEGFKTGYSLPKEYAKVGGKTMRAGRLIRRAGVPAAVIGGSYAIGRAVTRDQTKVKKGLDPMPNAFGIEHEISKSYGYDSETRRHNRSGAYVGALGVGATAAGAGGAHQGVKAVKAGKTLVAAQKVANTKVARGGVVTARQYKGITAAAGKTLKHGGKAGALIAVAGTTAVGAKKLSNRNRTKGLTYNAW